MKIRKARVKDISSIVGLQHRLLTFHKGIDPHVRTGRENSRSFRKWALKNIRSRNGMVLVAEDGGKLIGFMMGFVEKLPPCYSFSRIGKITDAFVSEGYRKRGLGKDMFALFAKWFRSKRLTHVELMAYPGNRMGVSAWKRLGFRTHVVRMRKKLS